MGDTAAVSVNGILALIALWFLGATAGIFERRTRDRESLVGLLPAMNFNHFLGLYHGERIDSVIVCNLEMDIARAIGARVTRVFLSADTMRKQRIRHPELKPGDYVALQAALISGEIRLESASTAMVLFVDTRLLDWGVRAHLKTVASGREIYADSFCLLSHTKYRRALAKPYPILRPHK